jgi:hypothetical protein
MSISTRSYKIGGDTIIGKGYTGDTKHDKASFKHSIEWHLKEIKEIKRPKNLINFCLHSSFETSCVQCVFRPALGCVRTLRSTLRSTLRRVELLFYSNFQTFYFYLKIHTGGCFEHGFGLFGPKMAELE